MARVLTEAQFTDAHLERLRALCVVPDPEPLESFDDPRAEQLLARAEILLTAWGCPTIDAGVLGRAPRLRAIVHAAGTVKWHLRETCWERDLLVTSAAAANAIPVAEYTLAAILFANKRAFRLRRRYREMRSFQLWASLEPGLGNYRKVVGVVGASRIGRRLVELMRPFDLEVQIYDPFLEDAEAASLGVRKVDLDELMQTSDVVTLHAPALRETHQMIDRHRLALMKDGATLINTARGWLIDGEGLAEELKSGRIDAVIDTTDPEVPPADSPLYKLPNVFLTPHIAGAMGAETQRLTDLALNEIERFVRGEPFLHGVRREDLARMA